MQDFYCAHKVLYGLAPAYLSDITNPSFHSLSFSHSRAHTHWRALASVVPSARNAQLTPSLYSGLPVQMSPPERCFLPPKHFKKHLIHSPETFLISILFIMIITSCYDIRQYANHYMPFPLKYKLHMDRKFDYS